ncbi:MAG TPA: alpha/beta fold hydrolase [Gaiellaceae bacterium]|nr:alpha/beta fold hydrolase [Gaiellaceae bacterium]
MGDGRKLNVTVWGDGEPAVFVHGSFGWGSETWREQRPLADDYRLLLVDRRGFGASPPDGRVDFERDAVDVAEVLGDGAHLVGHSYGGVVSLLAAARRPEAVRSLTVIEPPALALAAGTPRVDEFIAGVANAVQEAADPSDYRLRFLRNFGFPVDRDELEGIALEAARSSWHERSPAEAVIPFKRLRGVRTLVARGDWAAAPPSARERAAAVFHAVCDVLERELDAESARFPAAHSPQLLGRPFNDRLRAFWESA